MVSQQKNNKSVFQEHISKSPIINRLPTGEKAFIIDGNAILHQQVTIPDTFGTLAENVFNSLPIHKHTRIDFVTDTPKTRSIKDLTRKSRGIGKEYVISGPLTKVPPQWKDLLHHNANKAQIITLMINDWKTDKYAAKLHTVKLYYAHKTKCYILSSSDGKHTSCEECEELASEQEEADPRIITHLLDILQWKKDIPVIVRSSDTDVECLLLHYYAVHGMKGMVIMVSGVSDKRKLIDIKSVATDIGTEACCALVGWFYYTGSDTTSSSVRRGKVKPWKLLLKFPQYMKAFAQLGMSETLEDKYVEILE